MPSIGGQGQSALATEAKVRGLSYALAINLRIFAQKFARSKYRYWHFDLNAGSGFNDEVGCIGSPLTFLAQAEEAGVQNYYAGFCDHNREAATSLLAREEINSNPRVFVFDGDNEGLLAMIPRIIRTHGENTKYALGSILSDDNATGVPVDALAELALACPCLDIVIHWNSTAFKRVRKATPDRIDYTLLQTVEKITKPHWWIREPVSRHGFTLLVGRGIAIAPPKALGFHALGSVSGEHIIHNCHYTAGEQRSFLPQQSTLF